MRKRTLLIISMVVLLWNNGLMSQTEKTIRNHLIAFAGLNLPTGDFGSTSLLNKESGLALTGFGGGFEFSSEVVQSFELGILLGVTVNSMDDTELDYVYHRLLPYATVRTGSWVLIPLMGSMGYSIKASPAVDIYGRGYAGAIVGNSPDMTVSGSGNSLHQISGTSITFGYGAGLGVLISHQYSFSVRYLLCKPQYHVAAYVNGFTANGDFEQKTSLVLLTLGYTIYCF